MKYKMIFLIVMVSLLYNSSTSAFNQIGPPVSTLDKGACRLGFDYSFSKLDIGANIDSGNWGLYGSPDSEFDNTEMNKAYLHFEYGATDNSDLILLLGGADVNIREDGDVLSALIEDSGPNIAFGVALRFTFFNLDNLEIGGLASFSSAEFDDFSTKDDINYSGFPATFDSEIKLWEGQIVFGANYNLTESVSIYGGPLLYFIGGSLDAELTYSFFGSIRREETSWDIEESSPYGGYIGIQFPIMKSHCNINFAGVSRGWGIGAQWLYNF